MAAIPLTICADNRVYHTKILPTGDPRIDSLLEILVNYQIRRCERRFNDKWAEFDNDVCKTLLRFSADAPADPTPAKLETLAPSATAPGRFSVSVEASMYATGRVVVDAESADAAIAAVNRMIADPKNPLRTRDSRIEWGDPLYDEGPIETTGDVDSADELADA